MPRRRSGPRAGTSTSDRSELEGFSEGIRHRLEEQRGAGTPHPELESELARAARELAEDRLSDAETILFSISDRLDAEDSEPELRQYPRGLVAYDAGADRGSPTPSSEEPVGNRLRIVDRLLAVGRSEGLRVDDLTGRLGEAWERYEAGDRRTATRVGSEILDELDRRRAAARANQP